MAAHHRHYRVDFSLILRSQPNSRGMNKFLRRIALVDTSGLSAHQRDVLINKINELNQDPHFMKFSLLTHPEFLAQNPKEEEQVDYIRKVGKV